MYKQIKPLQPSGKMMVTPEQSEAVQKVLFEIHYDWYFGDKESKHLDKPFIFWDDYDNSITQCPDDMEGWFNEADNPLHIFTDYFTTEPTN